MGILIFGFAGNALATNYYVATDGSDSNSGTIDQPWQTVQKAANTLQAGDTAFIRGGTYSEEHIQFTNTGTAGNPITVTSYPNEIATIDGGHTNTIGGTNAVFNIDNTAYVTLDRLNIKRGVSYNIRIAYDGPATNITIRNSDISDHVVWDNSGEIGLYNGANNILIEDNILHGYQEGGLGGAGVNIFQAGNITIKNNEIYSTQAYGILYKNGLNTTVTTIFENNLIHNVTDIGIGSSRKDVIMRNNVIYNSLNMGIMIFEENASCPYLVSTNNQIIHNTLVNTAMGIKLDRSDSCIGAVGTLVKDNLIYNFTDASHRGLSIYPYMSADTSNTTFDHNLIYSPSFISPIRILGQYYSVPNQPLLGVGNIQSAPIFIDAQNHNYALQTYSPGYHIASDGKDMGADVSLIGTNPGQTQDTTPPNAPTGLLIE